MVCISPPVHCPISDFFYIYYWTIFVSVAWVRFFSVFISWCFFKSLFLLSHLSQMSSQFSIVCVRRCTVSFPLWLKEFGKRHISKFSCLYACVSIPLDYCYNWTTYHTRYKCTVSRPRASYGYRWDRLF